MYHFSTIHNTDMYHFSSGAHWWCLNLWWEEVHQGINSLMVVLFLHVSGCFDWDMAWLIFSHTVYGGGPQWGTKFWFLKTLVFSKLPQCEACAIIIWESKELNPQDSQVESCVRRLKKDKYGAYFIRSKLLNL